MIKEWLCELIEFFSNHTPDTVPYRIKCNRDKLFCSIANMSWVRNEIASLPPAKKQFIEEFLTLLEEYFHYFDMGYRAPHTIDELPGLIKEKLLIIKNYLEG